MSDRDTRRRRNIPVGRRSHKPSSSSSSPRLQNRPLENVKSLNRSKSEPSLWETNNELPVELVADEEQGILYRPLTCTNIFSSSANFVPDIQAKCLEGYNKDAKVVVNVMVEGSPGPIRTMIKLGSNVEEMIKDVINKYNEQGRTPRIDKNAASSCQLHYSYFSLESLSKSDLIGDVGTRSFYLRKNNSVRGTDGRSEITSESGSSSKDLTRVTCNQLSQSTHFLQIFIHRSIKKIIEKTRKIWRFFGCITCTL